MKNFLICLIILFISSCTSQVTYRGNFESNDMFYTERDNPQFVIDSICNADTLYLDIQNYKLWNNYSTLTSDNIIEQTYWFYNDSLKIMISVSETHSKNIIKMIKE